MSKSLYLHDVWVNFVQEDNFYNVPEFHEWRKEGDGIELLDQILLLKVNSDTFNYIAFGNNRVGDDIAAMIENKAFYRKGHERIQVRYMFTMSDGVRTLTVKLDDDQRVIEKSHLISRQYQLSIEMVADIGCHFEKDYKCELSKYSFYAGLTRKERDSYKVLESFLANVTEKDLPMIKYLLSEISYPTYKQIKDSGFVDCIVALKTLHTNVIVKEFRKIESLLNKLSLAR
jgi:hypothetical protein